MVSSIITESKMNSYRWQRIGSVRPYMACYLDYQFVGSVYERGDECTLYLHENSDIASSHWDTMTLHLTGDIESRKQQIQEALVYWYGEHA